MDNNIQTQQLKRTKAHSDFIRVREGVVKYTLLSSAIFSIVALLAIVAFLLMRGVPAMAEIGIFKFLFGSVWKPNASTNPQYGLLPMILGTLYVTALATLIGVTMGIFIAVFLFKFCPKKLRGLVEQFINLLAAIPSVIFGLFGLVMVVPFLRNISPNGQGYGILAAAIILSIMILPTIVSISLNALRSVSRELYDGALALGATQEMSVFRVMLPAAKSGVFTATVLSIGRAIGETMAVIMVVGGSANMPNSPFQSVNTLTALIAKDGPHATGLVFEALIGAGVVLLAFTIIINFVLMKVKARAANKTYKLVLKKQNEQKAKGIAKAVGDIGNLFDNIKSSISKGWQAFKKSIGYVLFKIKFGIVWVFMATKIAPLYSKLWDWIDSKWNVSSQQKVKYNILKALAYIFSAIGVFFLIWIIFFILQRGLSYVTWDFIFGEFTLDKPTLQPALVGTFMLMGIAILLALPIGIASAIFLSEYAKDRWYVRYIRLAIDSLAAIPSIVYGLFGYIVFVGIFGWSYSILAGGFALAIMVLPTVIRITEESLHQVHPTYREASLALGASKVRTIFRVILPSASTGVATAIIQSIARIVSESAVLILTIMMVVNVVPNSVMSPGSSLALNIYYYSNDGARPELAAATGVVLLVIILVLNLILTGVAKFLSRGKGAK